MNMLTAVGAGNHLHVAAWPLFMNMLTVLRAGNHVNLHFAAWLILMNMLTVLSAENHYYLSAQPVNNIFYLVSFICQS
jgi:hypothetical protein